jgi:CubicO group peptidase (beta-lactamase class C family)
MNDAMGAGTPALPPRARPEDVGLSSERLARIGTVLNRDIQSGRIPGAVVAIARRGKLAYLESFGVRDTAANVTMTADTIFNIASMTKPMTALAALLLYEEAKLLINDPLAKFFPQFANMKVAVLDGTGAIRDTVPAERPITLQDLMRHTSGQIYGARGTSGVHKLYPAGSSHAAMGMSGAEFLDKLATLPLLWQPGTVWDYGFGLDVLGLVVEKVSGKSLGAFLAERVFRPLGMFDTAFLIPPEKAQRYAKAFATDPDTGQPQSILPVATEPTKFDCGGGGAVSTASDYLRFALMLLGGGEYGGVRILGRKTTEYMLSDHLGPDIKNLIGSADPTRAGYGFGLGLAVRTSTGGPVMMGSPGEFNWPGITGTNWWADPKEELAVVFLSHSPGTIRWHYRQVINALVYQAIVD